MDIPHKTLAILYSIYHSLLSPFSAYNSMEFSCALKSKHSIRTSHIAANYWNKLLSKLGRQQRTTLQPDPLHLCNFKIERLSNDYYAITVQWPYIAAICLFFMRFIYIIDAESWFVVRMFVDYSYTLFLIYLVNTFCSS